MSSGMIAVQLFTISSGVL